MMGKIKLAIILTLITSLILTASGCGEKETDNKETGKTDSTINLGPAAIQDDWIYFQNLGSLNLETGEGSQAISKIKVDGSGESVVVDAEANSLLTFTVSEDWIYYNSTLEPDVAPLHRIKADGTGKTKVCDDITKNLQISGDWIFYINDTMDSDYQLIKIKTDGSDRTELGVNVFEWYQIQDDWIYYSNSKDEGFLYKVKTDGTGQEKVLDIHIANAQIVDDWMYFINEPRAPLQKVKLDGTGLVEVSSDNVELVIVSGGWIYYTTDTQICKIKTDGSEKTELSDNGAAFMEVSDGWIYTIRMDEDNDPDTYGVLRKMKTDGTGEVVYDNVNIWYLGFGLQ